MRLSTLIRRMTIWSGVMALGLCVLVTVVILSSPRHEPFPSLPASRPQSPDDQIRHQEMLGVNPHRLILYTPPGFARQVRPLPGDRR